MRLGGFNLNRLFHVEPDVPAEERRARALDCARAGEELKKSEGWGEVIKELAWMGDNAHDALMKSKDAMNADEYRGFIRAVALVSTIPDRLVQAGQEAAEARQRGQEED